MASRVFHRRLYEEAPSVMIVRRVLLFSLSIHVILATISGYRAIVQIYRLELSASDRVLHVGSRLHTSVVTSGRTYATVQLDLVQGTHAARLALIDVPRNLNASYDPRTQKAALSLELTPARLAGFHAGPAIVRAIAVGSDQWMRTPPPTVRDVAVEIARR